MYVFVEINRLRDLYYPASQKKTWQLDQVSPHVRLIILGIRVIMNLIQIYLPIKINLPYAKQQLTPHILIYQL